MGGLGGREKTLALAATGWRPQAVPVATKEATGIDSRDEGFPFPPKQLTNSVNRPWSVSTLKKVKREAAAQRRPAQSEQKNHIFSVKRQAGNIETPSVSN